MKIRALTPSEQYLLREELEQNAVGWHPHARAEGAWTALREGRSQHLQWVNDQHQVVDNLWTAWPKTHSMLTRILGHNGRLGRVYWHRLAPGQGIDPHTDRGLGYVQHPGFVARYQIYLDVDPLIEVFFGGAMQANLAYSIQDFPLRELHAYENLGKTTMYLLVFDRIH